MTEYIEREKAQDGLDNIDWYHVNDKGQLLPGGKTDIETYVPFKAVEEMLKSIPAADVRPVVRGKWLDKWYEDDELVGGGYTVPQCSACDGESGWKSQYCPNCGADMREES